MKTGIVICSCGKTLVFETQQEKIVCIYCGKSHDVSNYPEKED